MPYKLTRPPRDMNKVKCVKKTRGRNGEMHFELVVMFNYVRFIFYISYSFEFFLLGES